MQKESARSMQEMYETRARSTQGAHRRYAGNPSSGADPCGAAAAPALQRGQMQAAAPWVTRKAKEGKGLCWNTAIRWAVVNHCHSTAGVKCAAQPACGMGKELGKWPPPAFPPHPPFSSDVSAKLQRP